ncbi:NAD(P)-dependent alcohol dehydrogenase [Winogradskya consettensis]|nr:NAD(P)-dependent alcohol dehydrogenase [Actinoplanes consettensis]
MTAAQFQRYGGPEVLEMASVPRPTAGPGEVLVKIEASAVNRHDAVVRSGTLKIVTGRKFPLGVGLDLAGTDLATGAPVWGMVSPKSGHVTGSAAEYAVVPADRVAPMPSTLSWTDAAALVTSGTTALTALRDMTHVRPGERVLIRGAAGTVGMVAVQLAVALGAHVVALAGSRDLDFVAELGAHEVIDYRTVAPADLEPADVILDTVGADLLAYRRRLKRGGRMVTVNFGSAKAMTAIAASAVFGEQRVRTFSSYPDTRLLDDLAGFVAAGSVRPVVDTVFPLRRIADAHRALTEPGHRGKLVLVP